MRMEELQTGLWGYQKEGVYKLVASMEESYSVKLKEKEDQHSAALQAAQAKIAELEAELRAAKEEYKASRKDQDLISAAFLEAQTYTQKLKAEAEAQESLLRRQLQEEAQRQKNQLVEYAQKVGQLRGVILSLLHEFDDQTSEMEEQVNTTLENVPDPDLNLTLFLKKTGIEE